MNQKSNKGITLIALVITIIVLLILAGVTISMVLGDEGIITNAQTAKEKHTEKSYEETIELAYLTHRTKVLAKDEEYDYIENPEGGVREELEKTYGEGNVVVTPSEEDEYTVEITIDEEKQYYTIEANGNVVPKTSTFTFTIQMNEKITYEAEEGMTWEKWVGSSYSKDSSGNALFEIKNGMVYFAGTSTTVSKTLTGDFVLSSDTIIPNTNYLYVGGQDLEW